MDATLTVIEYELQAVRALRLAAQEDVRRAARERETVLVAEIVGLKLLQSGSDTLGQGALEYRSGPR